MLLILEDHYQAFIIAKSKGIQGLKVTASMADLENFLCDFAKIVKQETFHLIIFQEIIRKICSGLGQIIGMMYVTPPRWHPCRYEYGAVLPFLLPWSVYKKRRSTGQA